MNNWRDILHSNLGDLAHGQITEDPREFRFPRISLGAVTGAPRILRRLDLYYLMSIVARLVKCNAPLAPGIAAAAASAPSWRLACSLRKLSTNLDSGLHLHEAMRLQPRVFPPQYADMVEAGENSGDLLATLDAIMVSIVERRKVQREMRGVVGYLVIVLGLFSLFTVFLNIKVTPVFSEIQREFVSAKVALPHSLVRDFYAAYWPWLVFGSSLTALILFLSLLPGRSPVVLGKERRLRRIAGRLALRIPLVGRFIRNENLARCTRMLAQLSQAGYPLDEALEKVAGGGLNADFSGLFLRMRDQIRLGCSLSEAAQKEPMLPKSFGATAAIGEYHGDMPGALSNLADLYNGIFLKHLQMVKPIVFPIAIAAMGVLVFLTCYNSFTSIWILIDMMIADM